MGMVQAPHRKYCGRVLKRVIMKRWMTRGLRLYPPQESTNVAMKNARANCPTVVKARVALMRAAGCPLRPEYMVGHGEESLPLAAERVTKPVSMERSSLARIEVEDRMRWRFKRGYRAIEVLNQPDSVRAWIRSPRNIPGHC